MYILTICFFTFLHSSHLLAQGDDSSRGWSNFMEGIPISGQRSNQERESGRNANLRGFPPRPFAGRPPIFDNSNEIGRDFSRFPFGGNSGDVGRNGDAIFFDDDGPFNNRRRFDNRGVRGPVTFPGTQQPTVTLSPRPTPLYPFPGTAATSNPVTRSTVEVPGMQTRRPLCEEACRTTSEYNPVCGDDNVTYMNLGRFNCAVRCGKNVRIAFPEACPVSVRGR